MNAYNNYLHQRTIQQNWTERKRINESSIANSRTVRQVSRSLTKSTLRSGAIDFRNRRNAS